MKKIARKLKKLRAVDVRAVPASGKDAERVYCGANCGGSCNHCSK